MEKRLLDRAIDSACTGRQWEELLDEMTNCSRQYITKLTGKTSRISQLNEEEQAAVVESIFEDMIVKGSGTPLQYFMRHMNDALDEELYRYLQEKEIEARKLKSKEAEDRKSGDGDKEEIPRRPFNSKGNNLVQSSTTTMPANTTTLMNISAATVIDALISSPPQLSSTIKLFINKPIPAVLRSHIWDFSLRTVDIEKSNPNLSLSVSKLAPAVDTMLSQRCHTILDSSYIEISSRQLAALIKDIIIMFMKLQGIVIPHREEDFAPIDTLFAVILPLVVVYGNISKTNKYTEKIEVAGSSDAFDVFIFKKLLALADPKYIGMSNGRNLITTSPVLPYTLELLNQYDSRLASKLKSFKPSEHGYRYPTFDSLINEVLIRGLSGLFSIDTLVFVWDQGFITNFNVMLPMVPTSALLSSSVTHSNFH